MKFFQYCKSPLGWLEIAEDEKNLLAVKFVKFQKKRSQNKITGKTEKQLTEYFSKKRKVFDLPLQLAGTEFQKKVWLALQKISYGQTISYKQLAETIGSPHAARAVGNACNKNKIAVVVPCHRVIGKTGRLAGYAGGIEKKKDLLSIETKNRI